MSQTDTIPKTFVGGPKYDCQLLILPDSDTKLHGLLAHHFIQETSNTTVLREILIRVDVILQGIGVQ